MARRASAQAEARSKTRCAIYTRKSTEEGLEQEFNSLDAQREACAAYILSQRHEGWAEVHGQYDDGGFSGGNMDRPALKRLLADVTAQKVDVIVVYKVDRLTRALSDFAKIVEVLDARGASFVSVTQAFNTTTSMGRLTLNVLLSFAQFEREVTGERIRDKIAASKKKGMWMGGLVPLGYRVQDRKLLVDEKDAQVVRHIFTRYVALGSGKALIEELRADGYRTKERVQGTRTIGGIPFERGMLFNMLSNPTYIGKVVHQGLEYAGEHEPIIPQDLWDQVQETIAANRVARREGRNRTETSLLAGVIVDGHGRRMSPSHAVKKGRRYRYYVTHASEVREGEPPAWRMPAHDVEAAVQHELQKLLRDQHGIRKLLARETDAASLARALDLANSAASRLDTSYGRRTIVPTLISRVRVDEQLIRVSLSREAISRLIGASDVTDGDPLEVAAPASKIRQGKATKLVLSDPSGVAVTPDSKLVMLLSEARAAREAVLAAPEQSIKAIARQQRQCRHRYMRLLRLSWMSPQIVTAIVEGRHPRMLTPKLLLDADLPVAWHDQEALLDFA